MNVKLTRLHSLRSGIFSVLICGDIRFVTAEHAYPTTLDTWEPKIPPGTYTCNRYLSPKHGYEVFVIENVPGHEMIEIHKGNYPQIDSDGCILLGKDIHLDHVPPMVTKSEDAFREFMLLQEGCASFTMEVTCGS